MLPKILALAKSIIAGARSQKDVEADGVLEKEVEALLEDEIVGVPDGVFVDEVDAEAPGEREAVIDGVLEGEEDIVLVTLFVLEVVLVGDGVSVQAASIEISRNPNIHWGCAGLQDALAP